MAAVIILSGGLRREIRTHSRESCFGDGSLWTLTTAIILYAAGGTNKQSGETVMSAIHGAGSKAVLVAVLTLGAITAHAQTTILDFQGGEMTGTSTSLQAGASSIASSPASGEITASFVLQGSIAANNLSLVSYNIDFTGSGGFSDQFGQVPLSVVPGGVVLGAGTGEIQFITANGAIIGANVDLHSPQQGVSITADQFVFGPGGDSYSYQFATPVLGGCENLLEGGASVMTVATCSVSVKSAAPGTWTAVSAPELDPTSAAGGMSLLLGCMAVMLGRRKR